jgi:hypothetical protein
MLKKKHHRVDLFLSFIPCMTKQTDDLGLLKIEKK